MKLIIHVKVKHAPFLYIFCGMQDISCGIGHAASQQSTSVVTNCRNGEKSGHSCARIRVREELCWKILKSDRMGLALSRPFERISRIALLAPNQAGKLLLKKIDGLIAGVRSLN